MAQFTQVDNRSKPEERAGSANLWQRLLATPGIRQFIKYVITGLVSFATEISLLYLFTDIMHIWYIFSNSMALLVVFVINFSLNRFWAFRSRQPFWRQFIVSGSLFALNLVVGNLLMFFFTDVVHLYYLISKVCATGMAVTWNFFLYKYYVYK
ncbi:MAG: GtrA family protein [Bacillota bacterium]|jgi:putative flippase GtrA